MSKNLIIAFAAAATLFTTGAKACNSCNPPKPTQPTASSQDQKQDQKQQQAQEQQQILKSNQTTDVDVKNTNINTVAGGTATASTGASTSATTNSGNSTNNNTTVYEARRIPVSTAIGATASAAFADGCAMSGRGFGLGVQTIGVGLSGNVSGNKVWNNDSKECHAAALETAIVQKSGTPVDSAAALLTASERSSAVANAVEKLQGAEGQKLMNLFAAPAISETKPTTTTFIINDNPLPQTCPIGTKAVWDKTNNTLYCKPN